MFGQSIQRTGRRIAASAVTVLLVLASCKTNTIDNSSRTSIGALCVAGPGADAQQCGDGVCAYGRCREACAVSADCPAGSVCLTASPGTSGCRLPEEASCSPSAPCADGLVCASDASCRNRCSDAASCTLPGSDCRDGACVSGNEPPLADGGSPPPLGDAGACNPGCGPGTQCVGGVCQPCGTAEGQACCGTACGPNLTCENGTCVCGDPGTACCGGNTCKAGSCVSGKCACGKADEACCANATCGGTLKCAGARCTCAVACGGAIGYGSAFITRSDGTLWAYRDGSAAPVVGTTAGGQPFVGTSFANGPDFACGVRADGTVWCWNHDFFGGASNAYGQLGNGTTDPSLVAVQVMRSPVTPLTNVKKLFSGSVGTVCAIDAQGALFCWGYSNGILQTPSQSNSAYALPILDADAGAQVTGVAEVAIGGYSACLRKTDGTAWCWGYQQSGVLGVSGIASGTYVDYPVQVTTLFSNVTALDVAGTTACAVTTDKAVWCWGDNSAGQLGDGTTTGSSDVPVKVLKSKGGSPFTDAERLVVNNQSVCVVRASDKAVLCWGTGSPGGALVPAQYIEAAVPVSNVFAFGKNNTTPCFVAYDGSLHIPSAPSTPLPCP